MKKERLLALDLHRERSTQPKHERLKIHLVNEMLAGRLKPGQALPSEHHWVETLGVARTTVRQAMAALENDGLIRRVQGKGTFVADDALRKLKRGQDIFALVVPETRDGFYPSLLHGFETAAGEIHHQTIICSTDDNVERQADIILQLLDKEVGGVAINPTSPQPTPAYQIRQLQQRGIPVVFCHRGVTAIAAPLLAIPYQDVGRLAGRALVEHGHRRVAFFTAHPSHLIDVRKEGLEEALRAGGDDVSVESVHVEERPIGLREESCWAALRQMFARPDPPTAIYASFDSLAEVIYLLLPRLGIRVPEDVSLVGFGGTWRDGAFLRRLTSVVVDEIATGRQAVSLLHEMRCGDRPIDDNTEMVMELRLSEGETLAAPRK
jgi:GntR family transcriptional regulator, arabinose operon transcriptional repressor